MTREGKQYNAFRKQTHNAHGFKKTTAMNKKKKKNKLLPSGKSI